MIEKNASSLGEVLAHIRTIACDWAPSRHDPQEVWFRGQCRRRFSLLPALYRQEALDHHYDEVSLFEYFKALGMPYVSRRPDSDWEWYFLARHHHLPTRLLDWTESLLVAVYFAIEERILCRTRPEIEDDLDRDRAPGRFDDDSPTVWLMDAGSLNKASLGEDLIFIPGGPRTAPYLPAALRDKKDTSNEHPLAIFPPRAAERIVAQQGTFTLHGHAPSPLEELAAAGGEIKLARVVLDSANLAFLWDEIRVAGLGPLAVFPDLDNVAKHVAWVYQSRS